MPVKLGFIILSIIGVLRIPEEFYVYKDKDNDIKLYVLKVFFISWFQYLIWFWSGDNSVKSVSGKCGRLSIMNTGKMKSNDLI